MNRSRPSASLAMLAVLLTTAACADREPTAPEPGEEASSAKAGQPSQPQGWTSDDEFARVARAEVPGFAGFYLEADGTPVILLKDHRQREAAERYLTPHLEEIHRGQSGSPKAPVVRKVTHDFADLKGWADKLVGLMGSEGVHMLDVDEVENKVFVGVRDEAGVRTVRREAARLRVPPGVLDVKVRPAFEMMVGLQERTPELAGGYKIEGFPGGGCTLGFNALHLGISVFVTNSHCTYNYHAYDGGTFTQPEYYAGNEIGKELVDKDSYNCNNSSLLCRWSDAAYVQHNGARTIRQGQIAYTDHATGGPAPSLTVRGYYNITGRYSAVDPTGLQLTKTGMVTGTTYGNIIRSCVRTQGQNRRSGKYYTYECQDISNVYADEGDSGAAMYRRITFPQVLLYGILWGRNELGETSSSRLANIERDLGPLTNLCVPGYGC